MYIWQPCKQCFWLDNSNGNYDTARERLLKLRIYRTLSTLKKKKQNHPAHPMFINVLSLKLIFRICRVFWLFGFIISFEMIYLTENLFSFLSSSLDYCITVTSTSLGRNPILPDRSFWCQNRKSLFIRRDIISCPHWS